MYDSSKDLVEALQATPMILEALLRHVTQEQALEARGGDEGWSVVEVMCHLRDAEEMTLERIQAMRDTANPFLSAYDQEQIAQERNYAAMDVHEALAAFRRLREQYIAALTALPAKDWERSGQHPEQGRITISNYTVHIVSHDAIHAAQIARQLK